MLVQIRARNESKIYLNYIFPKGPKENGDELTRGQAFWPRLYILILQEYMFLANWPKITNAMLMKMLLKESAHFFT